MKVNNKSSRTLDHDTLLTIGVFRKQRFFLCDVNHLHLTLPLINIQCSVTTWPSCGYISDRFLSRDERRSSLQILAPATQGHSFHWDQHDKS